MGYFNEINLRGDWFSRDKFLRGLIFMDFAEFLLIRENLSPQNFSNFSMRENKSKRNFCKKKITFD